MSIKRFNFQTKVILIRTLQSEVEWTGSVYQVSGQSKGVRLGLEWSVVFFCHEKEHSVRDSGTFT